MQYQAEHDLKASGKFSTLDWPSHSMLMSAHRARGLYLRELVVSFAKWLRNSSASTGPVEHLRRVEHVSRR
jgi:hypothetical protein